MTVFEQIAQDEQERIQYLKERQEKIDALKRTDVSKRKRKKILKQKAKKAAKFIDSPYWKYYKDYIDEVRAESETAIRTLGLKGRSSEDIGNEVIRLAAIGQTLNRIVDEPEKLYRLL